MVYLFLLIFPLTFFEGCSKDKDDTPADMIIMNEDQLVKNVAAKDTSFVLTFKVRTNWELEASEDCKDWVKKASYSDIGGVFDLQVLISANEQSSERTGTFIMKSGTDVREIKVKQAGVASK